MNMIKKPIFTEKSFIQASAGVYSFNVLKSTTKHEIKSLVESLFKVHVVKITSLVKKSKTLRTGRRRLEVTASPEKTVRVWLKKGESIDLFDIKKDN